MILLSGERFVERLSDVTEQEKEVSEEISNEEVSTDEINELKEKLDELEDQNLRLQAEIQNMHRRNKKEREDLVRYRSQDLAKAILPVMDNLERALETEVTEEAGKNLKQGVNMVLESFKRALEAQGIEEIEAEGQPFNPNFHEAYAQVPAEEGQDSDVVAQVYEKGYKLNERVLRAAKVTVTQ